MPGVNYTSNGVYIAAILTISWKRSKLQPEKHWCGSKIVLLFIIFAYTHPHKPPSLHLSFKLKFPDFKNKNSNSEFINLQASKPWGQVYLEYVLGEIRLARD